MRGSISLAVPTLAVLVPLVLGGCCGTPRASAGDAAPAARTRVVGDWIPGAPSPREPFLVQPHLERLCPEPPRPEQPVAPVAQSARVRPADTAQPLPIPEGPEATEVERSPPVAEGEDRQRPFDATAAGVVVRTPQGWKSRREDEYTVLLEGPLRIPTAALYEPKARTLQAAAAGLAAELGEGIDAVRVTSAPRPATFAGYPALVAEGTGATGGIKLRWRAWVVDGRRLFVAAVALPTIMWKLQQGRVQTFVSSVRRSPDAP